MLTLMTTPIVHKTHVWRLVDYAYSLTVAGKAETKTQPLIALTDRERLVQKKENVPESV